MKMILIAILTTISAFGADFTIQVNPAANSIDDSKVSSLSISKITNLQTSLDAKASQSSVDAALALKADSSSLGSLASKSTITNSEVDDGALSSSKIASFAADVVSAMASSLSSYMLKSDIKRPTMQKFTTGTNLTYTTPAGVLYIKVTMVGAGGGGGGSDAGAFGNALNGGDSSFGTLIAYGGHGGFAGTQTSLGGDGGSASLGSGFNGIASNGNSGLSYAPYGLLTTYTIGTLGGGSMISGSSYYTPTNGAGGRGGGSTGNQIIIGTGGGAGGYISAVSSGAVNSTYQYTVGSGGTPGNGGPNGQAGQQGGSGLIIVEEFYQ